MQSTRSKISVLAVLVATAVVLFLVLQGGDDSGTSSDSSTVTKTSAGGKTETVVAPPLVITIDKDGNPVGGVQKLTVNKGDDIRFTVDSAVADEIHLHGYDIPKGVEAGGSVTFDVPASIEGVFEAELESRGEQILELTVNP